MSTEILQPPRLSLSRLLLLGASSVVLCLSYLMALFTPFPLAMATVMYGRVKGYALGLAGFSVCLLLGAFFFKDYTLAASYLILLTISTIVSESSLRSWRPVRTVVVTGVVFLGLVLAIGAGYLQDQNLTLHSAVTKEVTLVLERLTEARTQGMLSQDLSDLGLNRPAGEIAQEMIETLPGYLFAGTFFILWVNMYLVLKGRRLLQPEQDHSYDERTLLDFKVPFAGAYLVAASLALAVWGDKIPWGTVAGLTVLRAVGVFYFFQGFGVSLSFLNHFNVVGFFRTLAIMVVVFFAPWLLAVVGLFDTFFDFNHKFKKQVSN